jgi:hypothetical protein
MEDPANQKPNVYSAYESLLQRLHLTAKRPRHKIPVQFLNKDSLKLVKAWLSSKSDEHCRFPMSDIEKKALSTVSLSGESLLSHVLTAFQMKQLLSLIVARESVKLFLDRYSLGVGAAAKL